MRCRWSYAEALRPETAGGSLATAKTPEEHPPSVRDLVYELVYDDAGEVIEDHEDNAWLEVVTDGKQGFVPSDMFVYGPGSQTRPDNATGNPHVTRESVPGLVPLSSKYR